MDDKVSRVSEPSEDAFATPSPQTPPPGSEECLPQGSAASEHGFVSFCPLSQQ